MGSEDSINTLERSNRDYIVKREVHSKNTLLWALFFFLAAFLSLWKIGFAWYGAFTAVVSAILGSLALFQYLRWGAYKAHSQAEISEKKRKLLGFSNEIQAQKEVSAKKRLVGGTREETDVVSKLFTVVSPTVLSPQSRGVPGSVGSVDRRHVISDIPSFDQYMAEIGQGEEETQEQTSQIIMGSPGMRSLGQGSVFAGSPMAGYGRHNFAMGTPGASPLYSPSGIMSGQRDSRPTARVSDQDVVNRELKRLGIEMLVDGWTASLRIYISGELKNFIARMDLNTYELEERDLSRKLLLYEESTQWSRRYRQTVSLEELLVRFGSRDPPHKPVKVVEKKEEKPAFSFFASPSTDAQKTPEPKAADPQLMVYISQRPGHLRHDPGALLRLKRANPTKYRDLAKQSVADGEEKLVNLLKERYCLEKFLKVRGCPEKGYALKRLRELAADSYLGAYRWEVGSEWKGVGWEKWKEGRLTSDAELLFHFFNCHMDELMYEGSKQYRPSHWNSGVKPSEISDIWGSSTSTPAVNSFSFLGTAATSTIPKPIAPPMLKGLFPESPFTGRYVVDCPEQEGKPQPYQLYVANRFPLHLQVLFKGKIIELPTGQTNLFMSLVVFLHLVQETSEGQLHLCDLSASILPKVLTASALPDQFWGWE